MSVMRAPASRPFCSFCGKTRAEVQMLIGGRGYHDFICDECISLSMQVISNLKPNIDPSETGSPDEDPPPKYFGTIENWAGMTNDELIGRFNTEKDQERRIKVRRQERYWAIFNILQARGLEIDEIVKKLWEFPTLKSRLNMPRQRAVLEERNTAWEALKAILGRLKDGDPLTSEELIMTLGKYIEISEKLRNPS